MQGPGGDSKLVKFVLWMCFTSLLLHFYFTFTSLFRICFPGACPQTAKIGCRWTSQSRSPGSLSGCLSTSGQDWTPLGKSISLSGCLSSGGQDWTPLGKSSSPSGCMSTGDPSYTLPQLWQMCFHMASFGYLSVQIRISHVRRQVHHQKLLQIRFHMASFGHLSFQIKIKPFSNQSTPSQTCFRFASCGLIWIPFCQDLD